jgi:PAS domain S-box-containing protein
MPSSPGREKVRARGPARARPQKEAGASTRRPDAAASRPSLVHALLERAPDVVFRVRLKPRPQLEYINRSVLTITGYAPEEWYADRTLMMRIVHPSDRRKLEDTLKGGLNGRPLALRWMRKGGGTVRSQIRITPIYSARGALVAIEGIARDVTAEHGVEARGSNGDGVARTVFEEAPVGLVYVTVDRQILHVNHKMCEMLGYARDELVGRRLDDLTHPDDLGSQEALTYRMLANEIPYFVLDKRYLAKDGTTVWTRVRATFVRNAAGVPVCGIGVLIPIPPPELRNGGPQVLDYGDLQVDVERLQVRSNGRAVTLTPKEVLLLQYLIRHCGKMLPREQLLHTIWGYDHAIQSRTLDVHVCRLRQKLPALASSLVTIGHLGYMLSAPEPQKPANAPKGFDGSSSRPAWAGPERRRR